MQQHEQHFRNQVLHGYSSVQCVSMRLDSDNETDQVQGIYHWHCTVPMAHRILKIAFVVLLAPSCSGVPYGDQQQCSFQAYSEH